MPPLHGGVVGSTLLEYQFITPAYFRAAQVPGSGYDKPANGYPFTKGREG